MEAAAVCNPRGPTCCPLLRNLVLGLCQQAAGWLDLIPDPLPTHCMFNSYTELVGGEGRQGAEDPEMKFPSGPRLQVAVTERLSTGR